MKSGAIRSLLFVPGDSERKLERALSTEADGLILDLEDSVSAAKKAAARELVADFLARRGTHRRHRFYVRINALTSEHYKPDLEWVAIQNLDGVILPKSEPEHVRALDSNLARLESARELTSESIKIICIAAETPSSVFTLGNYSGTSERLAGLAWGAVDLAASLGADSTENGFADVYRLARSLCLLRAAAAGVDAFDTVYPDYKNSPGLRDESAAARRSGFAGKLAIHLDQVPTINAAFAPTEQEIEWASRVVASFDADPEAGAIGIDGRMIDRAHYVLAQALLSRPKGGS